MMLPDMQSVRPNLRDKRRKGPKVATPPPKPPQQNPKLSIVETPEKTLSQTLPKPQNSRRESLLEAAAEPHSGAEPCAPWGCPAGSPDARSSWMPSVESRDSRLSRYLRQAALLFGLPGGTGAWSGQERALCCEHSAEFSEASTPTPHRRLP